MPDCLSGQDLSCIRGERLVFARLAFRLEAGGALVLAGIYLATMARRMALARARNAA